MLRNDLSVAIERERTRSQRKMCFGLRNMMRKHPSYDEGECVLSSCFLHRKHLSTFSWQNDDETAHHHISFHTRAIPPNRTITIYLGIIALACVYTPQPKKNLIGFQENQMIFNNQG